jgi:hypothetical protein
MYAKRISFNKICIRNLKTHGKDTSSNTQARTCLCGRTIKRVVVYSTSSISSTVVCPPVSARPITPPHRACSTVNVGVCCRSDRNANPVFSKVANRCICNLIGGTLVPAGSCAPVVTVPPPPDCICITLYEPVRCIKNGIPSIASNGCVCECGGGQPTLWYYKECANMRAGST